MSMGRGNIMDKRKESVGMRRGGSSLLHYDAPFPLSPPLPILSIVFLHLVMSHKTKRKDARCQLLSLLRSLIFAYFRESSYFE